ncbi:SDR family oxidoreductase [Lichenicoccus sp.]|uniref:SDR family oxidoreductase n=1 Tax=Lichenicoccus sp. TaxID=2781899 RepID=UPI003D09F368
MRILVTGAAGLIGAELVGRLADRGHSVIGLVRKSRTLDRNDRTPLITEPWTGVAPAGGRIAVLSGDVSQERLGLCPARYEALAGCLDLIIHCAAVVGFSLDPEAYRAVNVGGARTVIALAEHGGAAAAASGAPATPVLHVSTAYVCGERSGAIGEDELDVGQSFANGYESSKAEAERLMLQAGRRGVPVAIARPSIVVGAWPDGAIRSFENIYSMIRLFAQGQVRTLIASPDATLDLVPIDHVCGGLVDIAERMRDAAGGTFHLVAERPLPVAQFTRLAGCYPQYEVPRLVTPASFEPGMIGDAERWLHDQVTLSFGSYLCRDPRFGAANLAALSGRRCQPTDALFLRRLVDHCIRAGFLRSGGARRSRSSEAALA